ncbi:class II aldolase [Candidatus Woesearchaeota archaeon]|nr:class II aldolase [Candidatus Woesearchaeota archaeon]
MKIPNEFIEICKKIGDKYSWVQGSGGNISLKTSETEMLIKASGFSISDIDETKGLVSVDYKKILQSLPNIGKNDFAYEDLLKNTSANSGLRPSMEAGFHSALGKYVVHSHPVSVNMIACLEKGEEILKKIFGQNFIWIDYCSPGAELSNEVYKAVKDLNISEDMIIIMQNHGMIISSQDILRNYELNKKIISKTDRYLENKGLSKYTKDMLVPFEDYFMSKDPLIGEYMKLDNRLRFVFPDAVVFGHSVFTGQNKNITILNNEFINYNLKEKSAEKINSMLNLHMYFMVNLAKLGKFNTLNNEEIEKLLNMESEKHREKMLR